MNRLAIPILLTALLLAGCGGSTGSSVSEPTTIGSSNGTCYDRVHPRVGLHDPTPADKTRLDAIIYKLCGKADPSTSIATMVSRVIARFNQ